MITIQQWIKHLDNARSQYYEGAINEQEFFNNVLAAALDVDDGSEDNKDSSFISNPPDDSYSEAMDATRDDLDEELDEECGGFTNIFHREETD